MLKIRKNKILKLPKKVPHEIVFFHECGDITPTRNPPIFENAKLVIFNECNKNFMYYWFFPRMFPNVKTVYIDRICDKEIFRFTNLNVYTGTHSYNKHKDSIWCEPNNCLKNNVKIHLFNDFETLKVLSN